MTFSFSLLSHEHDSPPPRHLPLPCNTLLHHHPISQHHCPETQYPRRLKVGIKAFFTVYSMKQARHKAIVAWAVDTFLWTGWQITNVSSINAAHLVEILHYNSTIATILYALHLSKHLNELQFYFGALDWREKSMWDRCTTD